MVAGGAVPDSLDVFVVNALLETPVHCAVRSRSAACLDALLGLPGAVECLAAEDWLGLTPLDLAAALPREDLSEALQAELSSAEVQSAASRREVKELRERTGLAGLAEGNPLHLELPAAGESSQLFEDASFPADARALFLAQVGEPPPAAAYLERADGLQALGFYPAPHCVDLDRQQRSRRQDCCDTGRCGAHAFAGCQELGDSPHHGTRGVLREVPL